MLGALNTEVRAAAAPLQIFFASETGNGEALANGLLQQALDGGLNAERQSMLELRLATLKQLRHAVFVISTHGEGDPPDEALDLFELLQGRKAPDLRQLRFRILALGDRTYARFCEAGRQLETLLTARGAKPFAPRVECDVDYADDAARWAREVLTWGVENLGAEPGKSAAEPALQPKPHLAVVPESSPWSRTRPFPALVEKVQRLTTAQSAKSVYHLELSLEGSGLHYQPGDSLGVWAWNPPGLVAQILAALGVAAGARVEIDGTRRTVHDWLSRHRELTRLSEDVVLAYGRATRHGRLARLLQALDETDRRTFIEGRQFVDLVREFPARLTAGELVQLLGPLAPRSYSIASSALAADGEVHLTVATLTSNAIGVERRGLASDFLNHRLQEGDEVGVFLEPNRRFRLPKDRGRPVIMVGAGTGIAPFRAFMQELEEDGESPRTWLIFGNPNQRHDFLYQAEWLRWRERGLLDRIDTAFSRDQAQKRYVQHVVQEHAAELLQWLEHGAQLYICGARAMGMAVEQALKDALAAQRGLDAQACSDWLSALRREKRLLKDLY